MDTFKLHELAGDAIGPWLDGLGELRMQVFREFPYLYEGTLEYEREYLRRYLVAKNALVIIVTDLEGEMIGATTCLPLAEECEEFQQAFVQEGADLSKIFYFGESVLLPEWRGRGIGKLFFDRREAHARRLGYQTTTFCAVERADDDPRRPADYRPLDGFWKSRGYQKQIGLKTQFSWREIGASEDTFQTLTFWVKLSAPGDSSNLQEEAEEAEDDFVAGIS